MRHFIRAVRRGQLVVRAGALARIAGTALKATRGGNAIDAIVMASAAQRGDVVYTSDVPDLQALARSFPEVRVLGA
jgi:hypothetical protein